MIEVSMQCDVRSDRQVSLLSWILQIPVGCISDVCPKRSFKNNQPQYEGGGQGRFSR